MRYLAPLRTSLLCLGALALQGCFFFADRPQPTELDLTAASVLEPAFRPDPAVPQLYRSTSTPATLLGIRHCGGQIGGNPVSPNAILARTRQLFVGFSGVKLEKLSQVGVDGTTVERAAVSATLDSVPVRAVTYSFTTDSQACLVDLVLWSADAPQKPHDTSPQVSNLQSAQQSLESLLPQLIPTLVR